MSETRKWIPCKACGGVGSTRFDPSAPRAAEAVEDFNAWFKREYPLYEREGRDTSQKEAMRRTWNAAMSSRPRRGSRG